MLESDHELMHRSGRGDAAAFEVLVRRWERPVCRVLARYADRDGEVEDLAQEVFLRVYGARHRYRARGAFSTWLFRIVLNVARSAGRRRRRGCQSLDDREPASPTAGADRVVAREEQDRLVDEAVSALPAKLRDVLVLRQLEPARKAEEVRHVGRPWENAKRALRGEEPEPLGLELDWGVPTKDDLVDTLLEVLAENAGNLHHVEPQDRLTVAITFPRSKWPAAGRGGYTDYGVEGRVFFGAESATGGYGFGVYGEEGGADYGGYEAYGDEYAPGRYGGASAYGSESVEDGEYGMSGAMYDEYGGEMYGAGMDEDAGHGAYMYMEEMYGSSRRTSRRASGSSEVAGDLHMRQGNYRRAIEAYEQALHALSEQSTAAGRKATGAVMRKMIQAYAALGDLEKARTMIEEALASQPKREDRDAPSKPGHAIPLPARLVVTVSKSQMDEFAAGKMTRDELGKHATVHYFNPPPETPGLRRRARRPSGKVPALPSPSVDAPRKEPPLPPTVDTPREKPPTPQR
jgi:RNA polymerase sigma-70 factor (ECF subfamily)